MDKGERIMTGAEDALTYLKRYLKDDHIALYYLTIIEIERFCADDKRE
jgi:hypothetical protein